MLRNCVGQGSASARAELSRSVPPQGGGGGHYWQWGDAAGGLHRPGVPPNVPGRRLCAPCTRFSQPCGLLDARCEFTLLLQAHPGRVQGLCCFLASGKASLLKSCYYCCYRNTISAHAPDSVPLLYRFHAHSFPQGENMAYLSRN